jgi:membrane protein
VRGLRQAFANFFAHQGFFLAAGLSFYFLICLIPLLFLIVSLAGFILQSETASRQVINHLAPLVPVYQNEIARVLRTIVARRNVSGVLGTVILVLFSTQLFASARVVLDRVLGVRRGRGWVKGMLLDTVFILLIGILFFTTLVVTDLFAWVKVFVLQPAAVPPVWVHYMGVALGVGLAAMMFYLLYRHLPNRWIPPGPAVAGALLASLLWEIAKQLFRLYILNLGVYDQIYGPLGVLVAFVMFVYYSAIVFILGAEYVAALERRTVRV